MRVVLTWILSDPARCDDLPVNSSLSHVSAEKIEIGAGEVAVAAFAPKACAAWLAPRPMAAPAKTRALRLLSVGNDAPESAACPLLLASPASSGPSASQRLGEELVTDLHRFHFDGK